MQWRKIKSRRKKGSFGEVGVGRGVTVINRVDGEGFDYAGCPVWGLYLLEQGGELYVYLLFLRAVLDLQQN